MNLHGTTNNRFHYSNCQPLCNVLEAAQNLNQRQKIIMELTNILINTWIITVYILSLWCREVGGKREVIRKIINSYWFIIYNISMLNKYSYRRMKQRSSLFRGQVILASQLVSPIKKATVRDNQGNNCCINIFHRENFA